MFDGQMASSSAALLPTACSSNNILPKTKSGFVFLMRNSAEEHKSRLSENIWLISFTAFPSTSLCQSSTQQKGE